MFKPVRKKINEIDHSAAEALLQSNRRGIIAMNGDESYPYAIPINYFYDSDKRKIYFHGAKAGHKVDALKTSDKVCFTVYGNERIDESESIERLKEFAMKYYPDETLADEQIARNGRATQMYEITIEHMSGKQVQEK